MGIMFRNPTEEERLILHKMCSHKGYYKDKLLNQVAHCVVRPIDQIGSLAFEVHSDQRIDKSIGVAVEAEALDVDAVTIHYLLHVRDGIIYMLAIYKDDISSVKRYPSAEQLTVVG
jgi:hypothetical protein